MSDYVSNKDGSSKTLVSEFTEHKDYKYSKYSDEIRLIQLSLVHQKKGKYVYVTPWSLIDEKNTGYHVKYDGKKQLITILWGDRVIASLPEEDLKKESLPDLRETALKAYFPINQ